MNISRDILTVFQAHKGQLSTPTKFMPVIRLTAEYEMLQYKVSLNKPTQGSSCRVGRLDKSQSESLPAQALASKQP